MIRLLILAAGITTGVVIALALVYRKEPVAAPLYREDEEGIQPADPWSFLLADPEFVAGLRAGQADIAAGRVYRLDELREGRCGARLLDGSYCQMPDGHASHWTDA